MRVKGLGSCKLMTLGWLFLLSLAPLHHGSDSSWQQTTHAYTVVTMIVDLVATVLVTGTTSPHQPKEEDRRVVWTACLWRFPKIGGYHLGGPLSKDNSFLGGAYRIQGSPYFGKLPDEHLINILSVSGVGDMAMRDQSRKNSTP